MKEHATTIIVINDDPVQLRLLSALLKGDNRCVRTCSSAEEALQMMATCGPIDLIVTDLYMPGMDGWRFCRLLRSPEYAVFNQIPILVVSATFSGTEAAEITADLGANAFLPLPVEPSALHACVRALLNRQVVPASARVLIVEDDQVLADLLRCSFQAYGYTVSMALTGQQAGQQYHHEQPEIAILDYYLPDMTADSLLEEFKRPGSPTVTIVITGDQSPERALQLMRLGADDYVRKPFSPQYLIEVCQRARRQRALLRVEELLEQRTQQLWESEERYRILVENQGEGIARVDLEERFAFANPAAEMIFGVPPGGLVGRSLKEFTDPEQFAVVQAQTDRRRAGEKSTYELEIIRPDGEKRQLLVTAAPWFTKEGELAGAFGVFRDITERKQMEQAQLKIQKLESLGLLAGGLAHDFNNLLMAILGNITLAKRHADPATKLLERLTAAEQACVRAKDLTQKLLTFATGGTPIKEPASISELIKESAEFVLSGSNVRCQFSLQEDLWPVEVDAGQISQVFQNLIINADQAMPDGGIIHVRGENITVGTDATLPLRPGRYVKISIEDQGIGIPKEHLSKIFDPYFTTKQKGSGLGLATAYSILKRHEGYITVESELGVGTTFTIYLPASEKELPPVKKLEEDPLLGQGRVLVMDDEEIVRDVTSRMLTMLGYEVELAQDGAEAIERYQEARDRGQPFDVVIMDLTVPGGIGGKEAIKKLREIDPHVRAIVSSGYSSDPIMARFREYGFSGVIAKPYKIQDLSKVLHQVLSGNGDGSVISEQ